jgi:pimeloyl-ACP methyl ester carboxylesterase
MTLVATPPTLVLIHSPLVGALSWQPSADRLRARGLTVVVPSLAGVFDAGPPYYPKLAARVAETVRAGVAARPLVLVGHSGAGALLPSVAAALADGVAAAVFVDAILPHPGATWFETAPPRLGEHLRSLAQEGWLPPWDRWFPPGTLDPLLADPALRRRFLAELPRVPLAYFEERAPAIGDRLPRQAYLQLSEPYGQAADEAERRGWPTRRESADHLAMLTHPELVVGHLVRLLSDVMPGVHAPGSARTEG